MDENAGLTASRIKKHEDHYRDTVFRLWLDGKLLCAIHIPDEIADEFEKLIPAYSIPQHT